MSRGKTLAKNTAILAFGKICTQFISFFLLPLYTSILATEEYGIFDLLVTYSTLLLPLVNWQFDQGLFRFMLDKRGNKEEQAKLFSVVIGSGIAQSIVFTILFFIVKPFLTIEYSTFLLLYVVLHVFTAILLQFVRGLGYSSKYAIASFISAVSTVVLNVVTLAVLKWGLVGLFAATLVSQGLTIIYLILTSKCWQYFSFKYLNKSTFKDIRNYSLPLIPNNLAWWVVNASDRAVISHMINLSANGIFTVASKFSNIFIQFYNIVNLSWTETVSLHINDEDRDSFLTETITTFYKLFSSACFGVVALMPFVFPYMINSKYADGYNQVIILMYAMLFRVLVGLYSCVYVAKKESKKIAYTSMAAAVINLIVDLLLIKKIGLYAASLSSLIAFLIMFIIRYIDITKTIKMKIKKSVAISSIALGVLLVFTYYSGNIYIQLAAVVLTVVYAVWSNLELAKIALDQIKKFIKH